MADGAYRKAVQRAHSSQHVSFGHFGTATYDDQIRKWTFLRQILPNNSNLSNEASGLPIFKLVRGRTEVFSVGADDSISRAAPSKISTNNFLKFLPDAACANPRVANENLPNDGLNDELPRTGLLEFGSALVLGTDDQQSGLQTIPIAAYSSPAKPKELVLLLLEPEAVLLDEARGHQIQLPRISSLGVVSCFSTRSPVLQLTFSARTSSQEATWLAVRQTVVTSIFQPLLHRAIWNPSQKNEVDYNLIIEIPMSRTGGLQHSDVAFHPRDARQFALIDIGGSWSIWKIRGARSRTSRISYRAELKAHGSHVSDTESLPQFDGWYKLLWTSTERGEFGFLIVVDRQSMTLLDLQGHVQSNIKVRIGSKPEGWILDVCPAISHNEIVVLTTSHVFLIAVDTDTVNGYDSKSIEHFSVIASWNHSRGQGDHSLRLYRLSFTNMFWLLLHSTSSGIITAYQCKRHGTEDEWQWHISDALLLDTPKAAKNGKHIVTLIVINSESDAVKTHDKNASLFKMFFQDTTNHIFELLYQIHHPGSAAEEATGTVLLPKKHLLQHRSSHWISIDTIEEEADGFIVLDGSVEELQSPGDNTVKELMSAEPENPQTQSRHVHRPRLCDLRMTHELLVTQLFRPKPGQDFEFENILDAIESELQESSNARTLLQLASDLPSTELYTSDIDNDTDVLGAWLGRVEDPTGDFGTKYQSICLGKHESLVDLYDELIDQWLTPLPKTIPDWLRVQRERLARQISLELYLSEIMMSPRPIKHDSLVSQSMTNMGTAEPSTGDDQLTIETQPTSSGIPLFASSQLATSSNDPISLLSSYVTFQQPTAPAAKATSHVNDLLAHLPLSSDTNPDTYDYEDIELTQAIAQTSALNSDLDPKSQRRAERLARARKKQLEKQSQMKRTVFDQSTALPLIKSSQLPIRAVQSSQVGPLASSSQPTRSDVPQLNMTQPERGVYGRREVKKGKGKAKTGRLKGF